MRYIRHSIEEKPEILKDVLMVVRMGSRPDELRWTIGFFDGKEWCCPSIFNVDEVVAWYGLPLLNEEDKDVYQMSLDDFWVNGDDGGVFKGV